MLSVGSVNATALLVLQRAEPLQPASEPKGHATDQIVATANGAPNAASHSAQVRGKAAEALFDRTLPDVTEMKVRLVEKPGEKFGISADDFDSPSAFGAAIRNMIGHLKLRDDATFVIAAIEKDLGLDKLGISLDTLVDATINPDGESDDKLEAALAEHSTVVHGQGAGTRHSVARLRSDDIGLYGF